MNIAHTCIILQKMFHKHQAWKINIKTYNANNDGYFKMFQILLCSFASQSFHLNFFFMETP